MNPHLHMNLNRASGFACVALILAGWSSPLRASAQTYALEWQTISGGGGTSTGGVYSLDAVFGDPVAGSMSGDGYEMNGGFPGAFAENAELIVNGSFENISNTFVTDSFGLMSQPAGSTTIPGWTTFNAELAWVNNANSFGAGTPFGAFSLELTGYHDGQPFGGVMQTISTTPGQNYRLSLALGSNADYPGAGGQKSVSVCVGSASTTFTMIPTNTSGNSWQTFSFNFTAGSTSTVVMINGVISSGNYLGLDNVSVTPDLSSPPGNGGDLVINGSFENTECLFIPDGAGVKSLPAGSTNIPGWTVTTAELVWGINGNSYGPRSPFGTFFLDLTGYHDTPPYAGVSQTLTTTPGQVYRLSFSLGADEDVFAYRGPVSVMAIAGAVSNVFTLTPTNGATGNVWTNFALDFTATTNATLLTLVGTAATGGAYLGLDNVSVIPLTAAPPELLITAVEKIGNNLRLSFASAASASYAIQSRTNLVVGNWTTLADSTNSGNGATLQVTVTNAFLAPLRFYRVWQLP